MSVSFFSYFNPTNDHFSGIEDFKKLGVGSQILTITLSVLAAIVTLPIGGLGGIAAFRYLAGRFKPMDLSSEKGDDSPVATTARKTSQVSSPQFTDSPEATSSPLDQHAPPGSPTSEIQTDVDLELGETTVESVPVEEKKPTITRSHMLLNGAMLSATDELNFALVDKEDGKKELVPVIGFCYAKEFRPYQGSPLEALVRMAQSTNSPVYDSKLPSERISFILNHPNSPISEEEFFNYILAKDEEGTPRICTFNVNSILEVFQIIKEKKIPIHLEEKTAEGDTLFTLWASDSSDTRVTALLLEIDPTLIKQVQGLSKSPYVGAIVRKSEAKAAMLFKAMEQQGIPLSLEEQWMKRAMENDLSFSDAEFQALNQELKQKIHYTANTYGHTELLKRLRSLGMQEAPLFVDRRGPEMIAENMDLLAAHDVVEGFLKDLKAHDELMTEEEFQKLDPSKYREKGSDIGRIQGTRFISKVIEENGLKHIKVPKKIAVVRQGVTSLSFTVEPGRGEIKVPSNTYPLTIYAQNISSVHRKLTLEEAIEFMIAIEKTGYLDFFNGVLGGMTPNFIVAKDGIYFIDTEFSNFEPSNPQFDVIETIQNHLEPEDVEPFRAEYQKRVQSFEKEEAVRKVQDDAYEQALQNPYKRVRKAYSRHVFNFPIASL